MPFCYLRAGNSIQLKLFFRLWYTNKLQQCILGKVQKGRTCRIQCLPVGYNVSLLSNAAFKVSTTWPQKSKIYWNKVIVLQVHSFYTHVRSGHLSITQNNGPFDLFCCCKSSVNLPGTFHNIHNTASKVISVEGKQYHCLIPTLLPKTIYMGERLFIEFLWVHFLDI